MASCSKGGRPELKRCCKSAEAEKEAKNKMKEEAARGEDLEMKRRRLLMEEVERMLSVVPRALFPVPEYEPSDDPFIDELQHLLIDSALSINASTDLVKKMQAEVREELRTKGFIEA
uniref:Uncharacterized protein n=1 Tax=Leersia perrieri TaxID=77586 RepID=A0A0D9XWE1_9ORYZ